MCFRAIRMVLLFLAVLTNVTVLSLYSFDTGSVTEESIAAQLSITVKYTKIYDYATPPRLGIMKATGVSTERDYEQGVSFLRYLGYRSEHRDSKATSLLNQLHGFYVQQFDESLRVRSDAMQTKLMEALNRVYDYRTQGQHPCRTIFSCLLYGILCANTLYAGDQHLRAQHIMRAIETAQCEFGNLIKSTKAQMRDIKFLEKSHIIFNLFEVYATNGHPVSREGAPSTSVRPEPQPSWGGRLLRWGIGFAAVAGIGWLLKRAYNAATDPANIGNVAQNFAAQFVRDLQGKTPEEAQVAFEGLFRKMNKIPLDQKDMPGVVEAVTTGIVGSLEDPARVEMLVGSCLRAAQSVQGDPAGAGDAGQSIEGILPRVLDTLSQNTDKLSPVLQGVVKAVRDSGEAGDGQRGGALLGHALNWLGNPEISQERRLELLNTLRDAGMGGADQDVGALSGQALNWFGDQTVPYEQRCEALRVAIDAGLVPRAEGLGARAALAGHWAFGAVRGFFAPQPEHVAAGQGEVAPVPAPAPRAESAPPALPAAAFDTLLPAAVFGDVCPFVGMGEDEVEPEPVRLDLEGFDADAVPVAAAPVAPVGSAHVVIDIPDASGNTNGADSARAPAAGAEQPQQGWGQWLWSWVPGDG